VFRVLGSEEPCIRCKGLGKSCGEKSRGGQVSIGSPVTVDMELAPFHQYGESQELKLVRHLQGMKPSEQNARGDPIRSVPDFKLLDGFEIDQVAIMDNAVKILERHYCTMDREKILRVVQSVLSTYVLELEHRESSPTPTISTVPKVPSRDITPDPQFDFIIGGPLVLVF
jgi:hypothetical protein